MGRILDGIEPGKFKLQEVSANRTDPNQSAQCCFSSFLFDLCYTEKEKASASKKLARLYRPTHISHDICKYSRKAQNTEYSAAPHSHNVNAQKYVESS